MRTDAKHGNLLVIVGPTAVGKTALSLELAKEFNGEIISGDSMQVYRGMDIGTAKATASERMQVPHHLIDIKDPNEPFSVAEFQKLALEAINEIYSRNRLPILVGGTGLYIKSVIHYPEYHFTPAQGNEAIRLKWEQFANLHGDDALWREVYQIDETTAKRLHPNDRRRLIRAMEIYEMTGTRLSDQIPANNNWLESPFRLCMIGLTMPRDQLYDRINIRVEKMIRDGLIDEVKKLLAEGIDPKSTAMQSLGYKEVIPYLWGRATLNETIALIQKRTRQFAKRQLTWFRKMPEIHWFDLSASSYEKNLYEIKQLLAGKFR